MPLVATRLVSVTVTNFFQKFGSYSQFPGGGMSVLPPPCGRPWTCTLVQRINNYIWWSPSYRSVK